MSAADRLRVALDNTQQARKGLLDTYAKHCVALGRANGLAAPYRRDAKRRAFQYINLTRAALRANARDAARLQAELLLLGTLAGAA